MHRPKALTLSEAPYAYDFLGADTIQQDVATPADNAQLPFIYRDPANLVQLYEFFDYNRSAYLVDSVPQTQGNRVYIREVFI